MWDLRQWRHCIFSDEFRFFLYHSDGQVQVRHRQGKRLIDACVQPNVGNHDPSVMVWDAIHHEGRIELVVVDGASLTGIGTSRSWGIKCCHGRQGCLDVTLCVSPRQCPATYSSWHGSIFWPTGCWDRGLASSESRHEPNWACFGLLCVIFKFPSRIFCRRVPGFATDCPCGVWCRGLTTCLLYVGPPLEF